MAIEEGVVIRMGPHGPQTAWVQTVRSSACEACESKNSCRTGSGSSMEVEAINTADARIGDRVHLAISGASLLKATFLLYLFPILCMIAGGLLGNWAAVRFQADPSPVAAVSALICLAAALWAVAAGGKRLGRREAYRPRIIRILAHPPQHPASPAAALAYDPADGVKRW